jgi:tetratricopeptide (TPR) repeat protein
LADEIMNTRGVPAYMHLARSPLRHDAQFKSAAELAQFFTVNLGARLQLQDDGFHLGLSQELVWLLRQSAEDFQKATTLDPTDTRSHAQLAQVFWHLKDESRAHDSLNAALAILNRAVLADDKDIESYYERAMVYEDMGEIALAIADLERQLVLSEREGGVSHIRSKLDELRKSMKARMPDLPQSR